VVEVMGRHVGWIALHSGIAGGADVILIPEIPFDVEKVAAKVLERERDGHTFCIVVVAEGAMVRGGHAVYRAAGKLGGIGQYVTDELERLTAKESRCVVLGHLQRGGNPTTFDRVLATQFGAHAVRLIHHGRFGEMVCYRPPNIESVPIAEAIGGLSRVDAGSSAVQAARALGISFGDCADLVSPFKQDAAEPAGAASA